MRHVAEVIGCTPADVEDVVSFYTMFYTRPVGKYVLQVCRTLSCALMGAERVTEELSADARHQGRRDRPAGMFTLLEVECLGACDRAPVVMVNNDHWHECQKPDRRRRWSTACAPKGAAALTGCHLEMRAQRWRKTTCARTSSNADQALAVTMDPLLTNTFASRTATRSTST